MRHAALQELRVAGRGGLGAEGCVDAGAQGLGELVAVLIGLLAGRDLRTEVSIGFSGGINERVRTLVFADMAFIAD